MDKKIISVKEATEMAKQNFKNEIEEFNKLKNENKTIKNVWGWDKWNINMEK